MPMNASEIKPGLAVWAPIFKKQPDIPATIIEATPAPDGGMLCTIELVIEDPFNNQVLRQVHKKPIHSDQLTHRQHLEPAAAPAPTATEAAPERGHDPTEEPEQPKGGKKATTKDLRTRVDELERENTLLELYRPALVEGAWRQLGDANLANRDLRYQLDEGERAFTRLAARLAEVEAYHPQLSHLKDEAASFRNRYRRVLYGEIATQTTEAESADEEPESELAPPEPQLEPEAASWTRYSQGDLHRHDEERRAWLTTWAAAHNYPTLSYRSHWRGSGYLTFSIPEGRKAWTNFLTGTWRYLAYCAFIEAFAPGQIEHYLGEAAQRGDIQLDQDTQKGTPVPETEAEDQPPDPASLTTYSRDTMIYQGPHDQARRAWLRIFAEKHGYRDFWFTIHGQRSGPYQAGVPAGEEGWTHFLARAVQYDIYCCFVAAYAPKQLEHLLNDAARRGEITLESMTLTWTPNNHKTPR